MFPPYTFSIIQIWTAAAILLAILVIICTSSAFATQATNSCANCPCSRPCQIGNIMSRHPHRMTL